MVDHGFPWFFEDFNHGEGAELPYILYRSESNHGIADRNRGLTIDEPGESARFGSGFFFTSLCFMSGQNSFKTSENVSVATAV